MGSTGALAEADWQAHRPAVFGAAYRITSMKHHLVLNKHSLIPKWVFQNFRLAKGSVRPVRESSVFASVPPRNDLRHLYHVFLEQP